MLLSLIKTKGHSMEPVIKNGSFFMVSSIPYAFIKPKIKDLIVFEKENKLFVKRIEKIQNDNFYVEGENKEDSLKTGYIKRSRIKAKVIWIF